MTPDQLKTIAQAVESSENQAKSTENPSGPLKTASKTVNVVSNSKTTCYQCGKLGHISTDKNCPARDKKCNECGHIGHFASKCRTKTKNSETQKKGKKKKRSKGKNVNSVDETDDDKQEYTFQVNSKLKNSMVKIILDKQSADFVVDSGASVNIIDKCLWTKLKSHQIRCKTESTSKKLYTYGARESLKLLGKFTTIVSTTGGVTAPYNEMYIFDGKGPALLGRDTVVKLGLLTVHSEIDNIQDMSVMMLLVNSKNTN